MHPWMQNLGRVGLRFEPINRRRPSLLVNLQRTETQWKTHWNAYCETYFRADVEGTGSVLTHSRLYLGASHSLL